jgi:hypothetical protein
MLSVRFVGAARRAADSLSPFSVPYRLLLFDIDGPLVATGRAGAAAWRRALEVLHGIPADIGRFTDAGMPETVAESKTYEVLPSVPERLRQVSRAGHLLGLVNARGCARPVPNMSWRRSARSCPIADGPAKVAVFDVRDAVAAGA